MASAIWFWAWRLADATPDPIGQYAIGVVKGVLAGLGKGAVGFLPFRTAEVAPSGHQPGQTGGKGRTMLLKGGLRSG